MEVSLLFKFLFLRNGKCRLDNCFSVHQIRLFVFSVKALGENVSVENARLRGSSISGLQGKAKRDSSQAETKRSNNIPLK